MFSGLSYLDRIKLIGVGLILVYVVVSYFQFVTQLGELHPHLVWEEVLSSLLGLAILVTIMTTCRKCW